MLPGGSEMTNRGNQHGRAVLPATRGIGIYRDLPAICGNAEPLVDGRSLQRGAVVSTGPAVFIDVDPAEHHDVVPALPRVRIVDLVIASHGSRMPVLPPAGLDDRRAVPSRRRPETVPVPSRPAHGARCQ